MGIFKVTIQVGDPRGERYETLEALVDTGASDTVVPRPILERLGVSVQDRWPYTLTDGRVVECGIGQTLIRINNTSRTVLVVFGEPDTAVLLGASSLEVFHVAADPVHKRLIPVPGVLMQTSNFCRSSKKAEADGSRPSRSTNRESASMALRR